ncbi:Os01g0740800 [Oryza sativa Japonica Group]|uniref:Os01g0740800 protein n=1 Tax=Oryza sativa subsp. japonica TaxID=39947 RepID=C7IWC8_ORYSJ|nr:Os01g0740800 [Oryza sativa Japonica Group]|eukprot:NP_001172562.1 Os01g0740800 [Oryza sativa Japonica Group]
MPSPPSLSSPLAPPTRHRGSLAPSNSSAVSASDPTPSWWETARSHILALSNILPPPADSDVAALADSDCPAHALLRSPARLRRAVHGAPVGG